MRSFLVMVEEINLVKQENRKIDQYIITLTEDPPNASKLMIRSLYAPKT